MYRVERAKQIGTLNTGMKPIKSKQVKNTGVHTHTREKMMKKKKKKQNETTENIGMRMKSTKREWTKQTKNWRLNEKQ